MLVCKNCGADIPFIPDTQNYVCPYCGTVHTHEELTEQEKEGEISAEEQHYSIPGYDEKDEAMEVIVYSCPQCGGELFTTEETLSTFCSYCGASVQLKQRVSKQEKPKYIIPFQVSKDKAMKIYQDTMQKAPFAPSYMKNMTIDRVRGIYMPFWTYSISSNGKASGEYETSHIVAGGTRYDKYRVRTTVELRGDGIEYDAASSFPDDLSQSSAPYHFDQAKKFDASYISGFYADAGNMPKDIYEKDAENDLLEIAQHEIAGKMNLSPSGVKFDVNSEISAEKCLYPVWFISARNDAQNKVSYAVINGQTGKIAADIPTDPKKMVMSMFVCAIPVFVILQMFFVPTPRTVSIIMGIFAIITLIVTGAKYASIRALKGENFNNDSFIGVAALCVVSIIISGALWFLNPFRDSFHYIGAIVSTILCIYAYFVTFQISNNNMTRDLPQFNKRGGDLDA